MSKQQSLHLLITSNVRVSPHVIDSDRLREIFAKLDLVEAPLAC
jgi:hypothetical protein